MFGGVLDSRKNFETVLRVSQFGVMLPFGSAYRLWETC